MGASVATQSQAGSPSAGGVYFHSLPKLSVPHPVTTHFSQINSQERCELNTWTRVSTATCFIIQNQTQPG